MFRRLAVLAALTLALAGGRAAAEGLGIGDDAPKLTVKEFVKGEPVAELAKGKTYVVEFWATWCGPCRTSIPHLTELQKKYPDITFIGVSVWESKQEAVEPFVKKLGEQMAYRVAVDDVPEGAERSKGKMAQGWMTAAGQSGIPTAFIVNGDGKVAWIGHPMSMDKPLAEVAAGKWDLVAAREKFREEQDLKKKLRTATAKLAVAARSKEPQALVTAIDELVKDEPKLEPTLGLRKFQALLKQEDAADKAQEYTKRLVGQVYKDDAARLNYIAWAIVTPEAKSKPDPRLAELALAAARRADELTERKNVSYADTLARAHFVTGDAAEALKVQERAVELAKGTKLEKDSSLENRLKEYRDAVKK